MKNVRFTAPDGYADRTSYIFTDAREEEVVEVNFASTTRDTPDLRSVMADRLANLRTYFGAGYKQGSTSDTIVAVRNALVTDVELSSAGSSRKLWLLILMLDARNYLQISYRAPAEWKRAEETFHRIQQDVTLPNVSAPRPPDGFVTRTVRDFSLNLPAGVNPPSTFKFVTEDRSARISVSRHQRSDTRSRLLPLNEEVNSDAGFASAVKDPRESRTGRLHVFRYVLEKSMPAKVEQQMVIRARLQVSPDLILALRASLRLPSARDIEADTLVILDSATTF